MDDYWVREEDVEDDFILLIVNKEKSEINEKCPSVKVESESSGHENEGFVYGKHEVRSNPKLLHKGRWSIPPELHTSYVEKLRNSDPELRSDEQKLVNKITDLMRNCKPEDPPNNFLKCNVKLECSICGSISKTFNQAKRHYQEKHGPRYLSCYACGTDFRSSTNLAKHEKKCTAKDAPIVLKARAIIVGPKGRNRPYLNLQPTKKLTNNNRFKCSECPATFKSKTSFIGHINFHKGIKPFTCDTCGVAYTTKIVLLHHIARVHSKKVYICDVCGLTVHLRDILIAHLKTHLPEKSFVCSYPGCDRQYVQKRTLQVHMDVDHNNEPLPHPCQMCHKRFRRTYRLQIHMKNHHGMQLMTRNMFRRILPKMLDTDAIKPNAALFNDSQGLVWNSEVNK